jgi:hypothetical protein
VERQSNNAIEIASVLFMRKSLLGLRGWDKLKSD